VAEEDELVDELVDVREAEVDEEEVDDDEDEDEDEDEDVVDEDEVLPGKIMLVCAFAQLTKLG